MRRYHACAPSVKSLQIISFRWRRVMEDEERRGPSKEVVDLNLARCSSDRRVLSISHLSLYDPSRSSQISDLHCSYRLCRLYRPTPLARRGNLHPPPFGLSLDEGEDSSEGFR